MELISVIVTVYNNEKYLNQCIDSILNQKYKNLEIILVDDGSTDGSPEICDKYREIDKRINVIHQENQGCIQARQHGFQISRGNYIGFIDSDDWIAADMYEYLMSIVQEKKCEIVSMGYTTVMDKEEMQVDDATLFGFFEKGKNLDELISKMMYDPEMQKRGIHPSLCTKIIRRDLLEKAFANVDGNITMGEDASIFYVCCLEAEKIFIARKYKYYYRIHEDSMCRSMTINSLRDIYCFYCYMDTILSRYNMQNNLLKQLKKYVWTLLDESLKQVFNLQLGKAYVFPYAQIEKNSDIILYGAGEVGQSYYLQVRDNHYCNIVAWADKNSGNNIICPDKVIEFYFSKILIAVKGKETADEITKELLELGIDENLLLWIEPQEISSVIL